MDAQEFKRRSELLRLEIEALDKGLALNRPDLYGRTFFDQEGSVTPPTKPDPQFQPGEGWSNISLRRTSTGPFPTLGEQLACVITAGSPGGKVDHRLYEVGEERAAGMSEGVGSEGGFLLQQDFTDALLKGVFEVGQLAKRCLPFEIGAGKNGIDIPCYDETSRVTGSRFGGVQLFWKGEGQEKTPSKPKLRQASLKLGKLIGLVYLTDELMEDVPMMGEYVKTCFRDEYGWMVDNVILNGLGSGQPLGVMNSGALVTVSAETGQTAATVVPENILSIFSRWMGSMERGVWLANRDVLPQLILMGTQVGVGGSNIYMPAGGLSGKPYNSILGLPLILMEQCQTLGTTGDLILADFGHYLLANKGGIQEAVSIHIRFIHDESTLRFVLRIDGQPAHASAISPASGSSNTLSPFVALETRP